MECRSSKNTNPRTMPPTSKEHHKIIKIPMNKCLNHHSHHQKTTKDKSLSTPQRTSKPSKIRRKSSYLLLQCPLTIMNKLDVHPTQPQAIWIVQSMAINPLNCTASRHCPWMFVLNNLPQRSLLTLSQFIRSFPKNTPHFSACFKMFHEFFHMCFHMCSQCSSHFGH